VVDIVKSLSEERGSPGCTAGQALRKEQNPLVEDVRITRRMETGLGERYLQEDRLSRKSCRLVALREVTDRKRAEERLLASQERIAS